VYAGGGSYGFARIDKRTGAETLFGMNDPFDFDIDTTTVFAATLGGGIYRHDKAGGDWTMLATGMSPQGLSLRDGWVYWVDYAANVVNRMPVAGGAVERLASTDDYPRTVVADCRYVYFSLGNYGNTVWRKPLDESAAPQLFANVGGTLAIDAASLYVQESSDTWRVALSTGQVTRIGVGAGTPGLAGGSLAVDSEAVYWTTGVAVMRGVK
jgi:hypothetical protein